MMDVSFPVGTLDLVERLAIAIERLTIVLDRAEARPEDIASEIDALKERVENAEIRIRRLQEGES